MGVVLGVMVGRAVVEVGEMVNGVVGVVEGF